MTDLPSIFGTMAFGPKDMRERMPAAAYESLRRTMELGEPLARDTADFAAAAMKDWALERGVTHYTHWFQPLSGVTAEKHDGFIEPDGDGGVIMAFSGKNLTKGEPDASSFPSGGLRATFEARGYTAWDPTSYAFIKDGVLCIPTAFCSYGGHALDKKTPLLRSMEAVNRQALRLARLFGTDCGHITPMVGPEQEYFLVDRERYNKRKDLIFTGRTLFGARPPKGQELEDHYFGSIKIRVSAFMKELNEELWKLGILAKTEHNETAPAQHELAPIFCKCNVAVDHNQITMEIMRKVAKRHSLTCLLGEKPFAYLNGSGKHNNWSLATDTGENLFEPGDSPELSARFVTFLCAMVQAVDEYQALLRISVASAGNDHRLGMSEAPPAIVSMYVGEELEAILDDIASGAHRGRPMGEALRIGATALPAIPRDTSDRNRTAPIAFTGNKFEFRMVGSSMSVADSSTVLNTISAEIFRRFADELEQAEDFSSALHELLRRTVTEHRRIIFSGNAYDGSWTEEAARRGLLNYRSTADAVPHLTDDKYVELYERHGVMSRTELSAYRDILLENYCKQLKIESSVMTEMVRCDIMPAVSAFSRDMAESATAKREAMPELKCLAELKTLRRVSELEDELFSRCGELETAAAADGARDSDLAGRASYFRGSVLPAMLALRETADSLESLVSKDMWPYPSYGKLLYRV